MFGVVTSAMTSFVGVAVSPAGVCSAAASCLSSDAVCLAHWPTEVQS